MYSNINAKIDELLKNGESDLHEKVVAKVEEELINKVLVHCYGNISAASLMLGINRSTVRSRINKYKQSRKR